MVMYHRTAVLYNLVAVVQVVSSKNWNPCYWETHRGGILLSQVFKNCQVFDLLLLENS